LEQAAVSYLVTITEKCWCGASIAVTGGRYRHDRNPNNPRGAEEIVERWRADHKHDSSDHG
jgi:hypothetical protein